MHKLLHTTAFFFSKNRFFYDWVVATAGSSRRTEHIYIISRARISHLHKVSSPRSYSLG